MEKDRDAVPITQKDGIWPRALRILENAWQGRWDNHELRLRAVEQLQAADLVSWRGTERRQSGVNFSDAQRKELKEFWDERAEIHGGRLFFRLVLWMVGSLAALAASLIIAYIKFGR